MDHTLYIHIPFCTSRCRYCSFYFETGWSPRIMERTLQGILHEAELYRSQGFLTPENLRSIYIGGGTPSTVPAPLMDSFLEALSRIIAPKHNPWDPRALEEFCIECNPESLSSELLTVLHHHGVSRISLGVQSFQDELLQIVGRRATSKHALQAINLLQTNWQGDVSLDFITGIPGQTQEMVTQDILQGLSFEPTHISVYSLTIEPKTPMEQMMAQNISTLANTDADHLWFTAFSLLEAQGFKNYEVSNFAPPGGESAHNQHYWAMIPYIGLGPGAVSSIPNKTNSAPAQRITNPNIFAYSPPSREFGSFTPSIEFLSPWDLLVDHLITATRTRAGLNRSVINQRFSLHDSNQVMDALIIEAAKTSIWWAEWLVLPNAIHLTDRGRFAQNALMVDFLSQFSSLLNSANISCHWP